MNIKYVFSGFLLSIMILLPSVVPALVPVLAFADYRFSDFQGHPPIHSKGQVTALPVGLTPSQIKSFYNLPNAGGHGTIAIVDVGADATIENDLAAFDKQFNIAACTTANKCFEKHPMDASETDQGWSLETALDVEWAHAIAPNAKILLVEAKTESGANLMNAVDYARGRSDVTAISMSWGGDEFSDEATLDSHFTSQYGASFFASSGDEGAGPEWPAASPNVVAVGGTHLNVSKTGTLLSETAWNESGGGISRYEPAPSYQTAYSIAKAKGKRSIPDVAYDADPDSGFSVYKGGGHPGWYDVGGTSAGAPQWAAIQSLGLSVTNKNLYKDKAATNNALFFRDIKTGSNGSCGYYCTTRANYDYVTGLGSPLTIHF
jgi:subtilase family serine protease